MENIVKNFLSMPDYDEYEMIKCLKDGGLVNVYLLYDRKCGRKLLLKCSEKEKGCLENEAEILSQIKGEGIPVLFRCFDYKNCIFLFREYIEGQTLKEYIDEKGKISETQAAEIGLRLCNILSHLHSHNPPVIHRDIKAENIVITGDKQVYIIDFGTARDYSPLSSQDTHVMGTPATAPPEQFGFGQTDERSDIYSLGVLLHQLVTGEVNLKKGIAPAKINKIIKRCTDFSPNARYSSAAVLKKALVSIQNKRVPWLVPVLTVAAIIFALIGALSVKVFDNGFYREKQTAEVDQSQLYQFKDKAMEAEVCRILGKAKGTVSILDLYTITSIKMVGNISFETEQQVEIDTHGTLIQVDRNDYTDRGQIISLEDISAMPNITELILCNQCISDLSPLRKSKIERLYLHGNNISDISPLSECYHLQELIISNNRISDFSPLINCSFLNFLNAGANYMEDLDDISKIKSLTRFYIHDCPTLEDYSALGEMTKLTAFSIRPVNSGAFDIIGKMTELTWLGMWQSEEEMDLNKLSELKKLESIYMDGIKVKSLAGMENFTRLNYLALFNVEADSLYPLTKLENLYTLDLRYDRFDDYSDVKDIPGLHDLYVSSDQSEYIGEWVREDVNLILY